MLCFSHNLWVTPCLAAHIDLYQVGVVHLLDAVIMIPKYDMIGHIFVFQFCDVFRVDVSKSTAGSDINPKDCTKHHSGIVDNYCLPITFLSYKLLLEIF